MYKAFTRGFTIVELSVVIAVIGILVAITAVSYSTVQNKARAESLITTARSIDNGLKLTASKSNVEFWFHDTVFTGTNSPRLDLIMKFNYVPSTPEATTLRQELGGEIVTSGFKDLTWTYSNIGDTRLLTACDAGNTRTGVVLAVSPVTAQVAARVDKSIDDSNLGCGRIRHNGSTLLYQLGFDQQIK